MANNMVLFGLASIGAAVDEILRVICCAGFALIIVMLFNFVLARYRSRVARTEVSEILESSMNYYTHTTPYYTLEPYGVAEQRIGKKRRPK